MDEMEDLQETKLLTTQATPNNTKQHLQPPSPPSHYYNVQYPNVTLTEPQMMTLRVPLTVPLEMTVLITMTEQEMEIQMMNQTMMVLTTLRMIQTILNVERKIIWQTPSPH